jgi:hypothetical protein
VHSLTFISLKQAASGDDENVDDKDDPEVRSHFDRNATTYPYKRSVFKFVIWPLPVILIRHIVMDSGCEPCMVLRAVLC